MYNIAKTIDDSNRNTDSVCHAICKKFVHNSYSRVIYTESHDTIPSDRQSRIPVAINPNSPTDFYALKRSILAAAVLFTSPGIPMLLQGQEVLELSCPTWPKPPTVDWERRHTQRHIFLAFQNLLQLRTNKPNKHSHNKNSTTGLTRGLSGCNVHIIHHNPTDKVMAYHRFDHGGARDDVVIIVSFSFREFPNYRIGLPRPGWWKVLFNSDACKYGEGYKGEGEEVMMQGGQKEGDKVQANMECYDGYFWAGSVALGRYAVVILAQDVEEEECFEGKK